MPPIYRLINIAGRRTDEALAAWRQLRDQCADAMRKLSLLQHHREKYRDRMRSDLQAGMPATAALAYLNFLAQIDEVLLHQQNNLHRIEQTCARQWEALVEARREKRTYEILSERDAARRTVDTLRRSHAEIDDLIQRASGLTCT
jgi:flagellar export protein FliJ